MGHIDSSGGNHNISSVISLLLLLYSDISSVVTMMSLVWSSILLSSLLAGCDAISCTSKLQSLSCLPVFSHSPTSLQKCYCTSTCPDIESLRHSCFSGQLQTDLCGVCLQCAPGFGEKCGGFGNAEGVCAGGLGCPVISCSVLNSVEQELTETQGGILASYLLMGRQDKMRIEKKKQSEMQVAKVGN